MTSTAAPVATPVAAPERSRQCLTFTLGQDVYAVDITSVLEILEHRELTTVPMMPAFLRGVLNLRGRVVPVVDLALRLGRGRTELARRTCVVIVRADRGDGSPPQDVGVLVDEVAEVVTLLDSEIEPAPDFGAGVPAGYLHGMARNGQGFVLVLDIARVLDLREMSALARTARSGR